MLTAIRTCEPGTEAIQQASSSSAAIQSTDLRQKNVTTIVYAGDQFGATEMMKGASEVGYAPEWLIMGADDTASEGNWHLNAPPDQRNRMVGVLPYNKFQVGSDEPAFWALRETDTSADHVLTGSHSSLQEAYHNLLVLASGIQMAGPHLTMKSFATGLERAKFPNPGAASSPYYQGTVGFGPGDFSMVDDFAVIWWSESAPRLRERVGEYGGFCWLNRGSRWSSGKWPNGEPNLFDPDPRNCR